MRRVGEVGVQFIDQRVISRFGKTTLFIDQSENPNLKVIVNVSPISSDDRSSTYGFIQEHVQQGSIVIEGEIHFCREW